MNTLFPLITEYNEEFKEYYTYRQIYFKWNINSEAYRLHKQYTDFPDSSYYWVYPKGEEPKERHVLFGTYYIQHEIWKHQFPATCDNKKFLIVPLWHLGIGSIIHILVYALTWALETDRILITKNFLGSKWGDPEFCDAENQSILCYLQPITNCTVSEEDAKKAFHNNTIFESDTHAHLPSLSSLSQVVNCKYVYSPNNITLQLQVPSIVHKVMVTESSNHYCRWYWRMQGATFITRLNERTMNWIREYEKETCEECKNEYDISVHIRHGDKGIEVRLIDADVYKEAIKIITSLGMKKNYTVYVNADDEESIHSIHSLPYSISSFGHARHNYGILELNQQSHIGLISFADLFNHIRADHCIGTISSNWCQLIYGLRSTVGMKSDGFIVEVGDQKCISYSHCILKKAQSIRWV